MALEGDSFARKESWIERNPITTTVLVLLSGMALLTKGYSMVLGAAIEGQPWAKEVVKFIHKFY